MSLVSTKIIAMWMSRVSVFLCWALLPCSLASLSQCPLNGNYSVLDGSPNITAELGPLLSTNARIYLPGSEAFETATTRWSVLLQPAIAVVVMPAVEEDVVQTVKYANKHGIDFLAIGGGHGVTSALSKVQNGIGIWMRGMKEITIAESGSQATIQAGVEAGEVTKILWDQGKQAMSTACDCVGFISTILGGGHGWLQGRHGLVTDNLISARVVLANSTAVTVSDKENPDLFWALRGAGHNFGILTSVEYRIFDQTPEEASWAYEEYIFSHDKLEELYSFVNQLVRSPTNAIPPIILFWIIWQGREIPSQYVQPIRALGPESIKTDVIPITKLNSVAGAAYDTPNCGNGASTMLFPIGVPSYNLKALRKAFDVYSSFPEWLNNSFVLLEGYSTEAVHRVPAESTAFPDRFNELLLAPLMIFAADSGPERYEIAQNYAEKIREALVEGNSGVLHAYVNYAHGNEELKSVYGYEEWRLEKLRRLKKEWDPEGKFGFYVPIE
ncbi:uncharacterized protein BCR38DRAFT_403853 [Pseudomassariella vexata]|uniref:FAD-binding PCMH-type domain-containing protein n=1 Tax=Pseudomassariella vexata TaxID=1141098 RepID=A0A1Y2D6K1_9PEZI|nr:uncharacterized protein BCR38DRAFT_403853 [Pseudomassariella vexata]ORY54706.1 hypothetical protein BCR38DRAFT_403853 [Pseudomassariella vexata]